MRDQSSDNIRYLVRDHYGKVAVGRGCGYAGEINKGCCTPDGPISQTGRLICILSS